MIMNVSRMIQKVIIMDYVVNEKGILLEVEPKVKTMSDAIVDRLIYYRKKSKMTQQDVADATGIKRANIARIESKKHAITLESLIKYANCLNCDIYFDLKERS